MVVSTGQLLALPAGRRLAPGREVHDPPLVDAENAVQATPGEYCQARERTVGAVAHDDIAGPHLVVDESHLRQVVCAVLGLEKAADHAGAGVEQGEHLGDGKPHPGDWPGG